MTTLAQACQALATDHDFHLLSEPSKRLIMKARQALVEESAKRKNTFFNLPKSTHSFYRDDLIKFLVRDGVIPIFLGEDEENFHLALSMHPEVMLAIIEPQSKKEFDMLRSLGIEGNEFVNKVIRDDKGYEYNIRFYIEYKGQDLVSMKRTLFAQYDIHAVHKE